MLDLSLMQPLKVNFIIFIYSLLLQLLLKHLFKQNHKKINFLNRLKKEKIVQFSPSLLANIYSITIILIPLCGFGETSVSLHFFPLFLEVSTSSCRKFFFLEIFCFLVIYFIVRIFLLFGSNSRGIFSKSLYTCGLCVMYKYLIFFLLLTNCLLLKVILKRR